MSSGDQELLPCPFCGGEAHFIPYKRDGLTLTCKSFGCVRRDQRVLRYSIEWLRAKMTEDWNRRAEREADRAVMREALEALKYHTEQTRPITATQVAIHSLQKRLSPPSQA